MNLYSKMMNKLINRIGINNLPYAFLLIFILFATGMAIVVHQGIEKIDNHYEQQFDEMEESFKGLDAIEIKIKNIRDETRQLIEEVDTITLSIKEAKEKEGN